MRGSGDAYSIGINRPAPTAQAATTRYWCKMCRQGVGKVFASTSGKEAVRKCFVRSRYFRWYFPSRQRSS